MEQSIRYFADKILAGELVAFPTETVYGIGANAFDSRAVSKIFAVKGRPADNPLIVHVASISDVTQVASSVDALSERIFTKFSPGPITVLLPKKDSIPAIVTAGSPLVGVRIPSHPLARELIITAGVPIAAPSANKSGKPSSTHHSQVIDAFGETLPNVIQGGSSSLGLESTVVLAKNSRQITILRQGAVSMEELQHAFPEVKVVIASKGDFENAPSPGIKYKHYAPSGIVETIGQPIVIDKVIKKYKELEDSGETVIVLCSSQLKSQLPTFIDVIVLGNEGDLNSIAQNLYSSLLAADLKNATRILIHTFPKIGIGRTIMERIERIL